MRTELADETMARLAVAGLRDDRGRDGVSLDLGSGALAAPPAAFRELVEPGTRLEMRAALAAGGAVRGGRLHPVLYAGVRAVRGGQIAAVERAGAAPVEVWADPPAAALTAIDPTGCVRLVPLPAAALTAAVALLAGIDDGPAAPGEAETTTPAELAARLAAAQFTHARVTAGDAIVEVLGGADGWRAVTTRTGCSQAYSRP